MITGRRPFKGEHEAAIMYSLMNEMPEPLARYKTNAPDELQRVVGKALLKERDERYQHADEMVADLLDLIRDSSDEERGAAPRYARKIGSLQIVAANITSLANASHTYVDNNHTPPNEEQAEEMREVEQDGLEIVETCVDMLEERGFGKLPATRDKVFLLKEKIRNFDRRQMKRIKGGTSKTRQSLLFLGTLNKVERIADQGIVLVNLYQQSHEDLSD